MGVGHGPIGAAVGFAVAEASRLGCGVHLVHAVPANGPGLVAQSPIEHERRGRAVLREALEQALEAPGGAAPVTSGVVEGATVPAIVSAAADARLIVLEHRRRRSSPRVVTRSVAGGVAPRARAPVVCVPSSWSADPRARTDRVTVGVDRPERSHQVLRMAGREASRRESELHVLHAWHLGTAEDALPVDSTVEATWAGVAEAAVELQLDQLGGALEGVATQVEVRHAPAVESLLDASRDSDLLVVALHDLVQPVGSHLGPVTRAVLQDASCPVLLTDPHP
ncbi:universal stress protein [Nocardioides coralli]|uniref:universal stress protein n=1 Tax=Nocardioides coralli TaxID=2872154 RepID=UPI0024B4FFCF|nr:universal stress protein [Nocardioides coralli]